MESAILITGANGGIGHHILAHLLDRGHRNVFAQFRSGDERVVPTLQAAGLDPTSHSFRADLRDPASVADLHARIRARFDRVSTLLNVAGSSSNGMSWKLDRDQFMQIVEDNLLTTFLCCKEFIPSMREAGFGRIVNFSSIVGATGVAGASHYSAAKAGVAGFTKSLALELAGKGITANALALGYFDAGMIHTIPDELQKTILSGIPAGRFGGRNDVGAAVEYLISPGSQFLNGQVLHLNGGQF